MKTFHHCAVALAAASGLFAAASIAAAPVAGVAPQRQTEAALVRYLDSEMRERRIPGLQIAVVKDGKLVFSHALGLANLQHRVPVSTSTLFSINSATKAFTGVALMQLVQQGKVDLAAPVSRYVAGLPLAWQAVSVTELLNHTSGIPDVIERATGQLLPGGPERVWQAVQALPMEFSPGTRYRYNQTNYLLLGKIIERQSGEPVVAFIRHKQFDAAAMVRSGFGDSLDVVAGKANSYRYARDASVPSNVIEDFPPYLRAGAGINSSANELANWIIALQAGRLIGAQQLTQMWNETTLADGRPAPWALGWPVIARPAHRALAGMGGARSAFYVYPDDALAVVILTNLAGAEPEQLIDTVAGFYVPAIRTRQGGAYAAYRLREAVGRSGFDALEATLRRLRAQHGIANPGADDLNAWGYRLLGKQQRTAALAVLGLASRLYPENANAHDSLAEAYQGAGDAAGATRHYRRALALDPDNRHAAEQLQALGKMATEQR